MFKKHKCNSIQKNSLLYSLNGQASLKLTNINMQIIGICNKKIYIGRTLVQMSKNAVFLQFTSEFRIPQFPWKPMIVSQLCFSRAL